MSDPNSNAAEGGSNPIAIALWIALGTFALVVGIILLAHTAVGLHGGRKDDPAMSREAVAKRVAPVASLAVDPNAPAPAPSAPAVPAAGASSAAAKVTAAPNGKAIYEASCTACHTAGVAGAPRLGDKAAWSARAKGGADALVASSIKGKGAMPPKGGNPALTDADLKAAVDYLLAASK